MSRREVDVGASTLKSLGTVDGAIDKEGERLACKSQTVYTKVATHTLVFIPSSSVMNGTKVLCGPIPTVVLAATANS